MLPSEKMNNISWEISPAEHQANMVQFAALNPQMGRIDGNTARGILMKSNLAPQLLAQVWNLADMDKDGMLTGLEYSIAIKLIRNCMAGAPLPLSLPSSILQSMMSSVPPIMASNVGFTFGSPPAQSSFPAYNNGSSSARSMSVSGPSGGTPSTPGKQLANWTIPHNSKLKYSQQFNHFDKQRVGFLSGQVGRSALGQSGLPTPLLAHIWGLSDVNKDGRLSVDEFYIAMYLIDMQKAGYTLPDSTPPELIQMCGLSRSANNSPQLEPGAPPAQKFTVPKTFEDKRMDNFVKGQAELERRRQILIEEENRRKAEEDRRQRDIAEELERERLEKERRREAERQAEIERMRMLEEARLEEERKRESEREAVRLENERQRMVEMEKQRLKDLQSHKQQEAEKTAQRQQRQKTLGFQLQALNEKHNDTDGEISKSRDRITEITNEIDGMRGQRDEKMKRIGELQSVNQELSVQAQEIAHQLLQLQSANKDISARKTEIETSEKRRDQAHAAVETMRRQLEQLRQKAAAQKEATQKKKMEADQKKQELNGACEEYRRVTTLLAQLQIQARAKLAEVDAALASRIAEEQERQAKEARAAMGHEPFAPQIEHKTNGIAGNALPTSSASGTTKYRAIFEFVARSDDELSFQPGDMILVFEGHVAEVGWRAGQIRDKIGWFPEAFAEPIATVATHPTQPIQNMPPNVTPSPSLDRIPEESVAKFNAAVEEACSTSAPSTIICTCVAQFPWKARNDEDLSFAKGDIIEVVHQQDMKWKGKKSDGSLGWFPKSYVKLQATSKPPSVTQSVDKSTPTTPTAVLSHHGSLTHQFSSGSQMPPSVSQQSVLSNASDGSMYVAIFEFEAAENTDLSLSVGDKILVLEKNDSWWKGRASNGKEGIFPANYVEKYEPPATVTDSAPLTVVCRVRVVADFNGSAANQLSLKIGDEIAVREKSDAGWWEGEIVRDGKKASGWFPGEYTVATEDSVMTSPGDVSATALFDYTANQEDELTFKSGDIIIVDNKADDEWWTGHHPSKPTVKGLFPSSYVQSSSTPIRYEAPPSLSSLYELPPLEPQIPSGSSQLYDLPPTVEQYKSTLYDLPPVVTTSKKYDQLTEELLSTEERYCSDLILAKKLFYQSLLPTVNKSVLDGVFINWDQLIDVSKRVLAHLKRGDSPAKTFLFEIDALSAFVTFCKNQQTAVDSIPQLLASPEARALYSQCCASPHARGMSLGYFLMIPLGRVTRYPLILEKMLKESPFGTPEHTDLESALQLLRALVSEVNRAVSEIETLSLLYWCQQHVKCPGQQIEFSSPTRLLGNRQFLHSAVLYKARSNRLLVGILFNDFLLMTTPDEHISEPDTFRVSKTAETNLTMYKTPFLLNKTRLEQNKEQETHFNIVYDENMIVQLKAVSRNAAKLWTSQLQQTIDNNIITIAEKEQKKRSVSKQPIGRLLVELMSLPNVTQKTVGPPPHLITTSVGSITESFDVDATKGELKLTAQFPFFSTDVAFNVALFQKKLFRPDMPVLEQASISLQELLAESAKHRGPILKPLPLRRTRQTNTEGIVVKFVAQLYESEI